MPQLMPLPWIFSCWTILFLVFMLSALYSKYPFCLNSEEKQLTNYSLLWLW